MVFSRRYEKWSGDSSVHTGDVVILTTPSSSSCARTPARMSTAGVPQLVTALSDPGDTAGSLFETARSAGVGLLLATQSPAGLSNDEVRRRRALTSGAALIFGRTKDPEEVVQYAGTVMQMESSGAATGDELRSARAQHTFVIPPQDVPTLLEMGAAAVFPPGTVIPDAAYDLVERLATDLGHTP